MDARNNITHLSTHNHSSAGLPLSSGRVGRHLTKYQQAAPRPTGGDFLSDVHFLDLISGQTYTLDEMRMRKLDRRLGK